MDGTGAPWFHGSIGIDGDRIRAVGCLDGARAKTSIDADGLVVAPGFVDSHIHTDVLLLREPIHEASLYQGVTTHVVGQDGFGFAPTAPASFEFVQNYTSGVNGVPVPVGPGSVASYLARFDRATAVNVATLIPNGCVRMDVVGTTAREATSSELARMASICQVAMKEGAIGLSSGLEYVPSCHASTSELITLCRAIGDAGGIYVSHIRYQDGLIPALQEAIEIGRRARVPVHVSHLRGDRDVGVSSEDVLEVVDLARIEGIDVSFDMYPYSYGCTFLPYALPPWLFQGTVRDIMARLRGPEVRDRIRAWLPSSTWSWSDATIAGHLNEAYCAYVGLDLLSASQLADADLVDFVCDILIAHKLEILLIWKPNDSPAMTADLSAMLRHPAHTLGSDGVYKQGRVHPRGFGAFARFIGRYVREESLLSFEEAIRHVTSAPARRFNLSGRGEIRDGFIADLVVFDPHTFIDRATYETGSLLAEGVRDVIVNGVTAMRDGWPTGATPGRGIRGLGCNHRLSHCSSRRNNPSINDRAAR